MAHSLRVAPPWQAQLDSAPEREWASTEPGEEIVVSEPNTSPELVALAKFAEALADPIRRRETPDTLDLFKEAAGGEDAFNDLEPNVRNGIVDLLDGLTQEEVRVLVRLQRRMVELDPDGTLGLTEQVEIGSFATLAKL
jgi:hypothetical protein